MDPLPQQDIADFLVLSRQCEIEGLRHLLDASQFIGSIRSLIHSLQRERGASNLYLNTQGQYYAERLVDYRGDAKAAEGQLRAQLTGWLERPRCHHAGSRLYANVALALHGLGELPALRDTVEHFHLTAPEAMQRYNELIRRLLAVVFEAADTASDPPISRALVALLNFMQGKELAGQERATGVAGFSQGWQDDGVRQSLLHLIDAQERSFQIFSEFGEGTALNDWQQLLASPLTAEVERLRRIACTQRPGEGSGLELAQIWFEQTTRRIDKMKHIEDALEAQLHALCESRLRDADAELSQDEGRIAELAAQGDTTMPVAVLFGHSLEAGGAEAGRSLVELVQSQARRLRSMEDELQAARAALEERRLIEQAKALLIKHRGMTEDEAYRVLRKAAMDQGKRLIEVARAAIAMAEVLGSKF